MNNIFNSVSGGTLQTALTSKYTATFTDTFGMGRKMVIISGAVTVDSSTGTAILYLKKSMSNITVVVTPNTNDSSGSGGDLGYGTGSSSTIRITKDYTSKTNTNTLNFIIIGDEAI